jgi:hypothetical protein
VVKDVARETRHRAITKGRRDGGDTIGLPCPLAWCSSGKWRFSGAVRVRTPPGQSENGRFHTGLLGPRPYPHIPEAVAVAPSQILAKISTQQQCGQNRVSSQGSFKLGNEAVLFTSNHAMNGEEHGSWNRVIISSKSTLGGRMDMGGPVS